MRISLIIACTITTFIISCRSPHTDDVSKYEPPKALDEDKSSSFEISSKRSSNDLVENIYAELLEKNPELKSLEGEIAKLKTSKHDTTASFDEFNDKNKNYYNIASNHVDRMNDSLLKSKLKAILANSIGKYNASIISHNQLLKEIELRNTDLADLHEVLKITRTLAVMENFQQKSFPSTKPMEKFITNQNRVIKTAEALAKK